MSSESADHTARERARNFESRFDGRLNYGYKGIPIFAAPGLHELAAERLAIAVTDAHAQVLELGAGAGALSQRLADRGYRVCASDLFDANFTPRERIPFVALDLNQPFAVQLSSRFDAVVALELIEHLENPRHFFRQCRQLLHPGGHLVVSTPNLANPVSQAMFLREGVFQWFRDTDYQEQGHIMPLAPAVLRRCWAEAGFDCAWEGSVSDPYRLLHRRRNRGTRLLARMLATLSKTPRPLQGEVYVAVLRIHADA
ncbi:class I SAM-dependent methyltransferase [Lysobacter solisilvae (ex Woo and Kim 2020)]|uniref:Methyltransferase domain-containing protein n=1 Tax=Agrilutibacter terrestris TaxID=2865112 RepID=A0A7H0G0B7_9GAMM|nr:methyltransferase domain-containing protein [Lysobacter terrestris]QNP41733.1 methyltransferase domain-containing protein [Lysobacter terrestris]